MLNCLPYVSIYICLLVARAVKLSHKIPCGGNYRLEKFLRKPCNNQAKTCIKIVLSIISCMVSHTKWIMYTIYTL